MEKCSKSFMVGRYLCVWKICLKKWRLERRQSWVLLCIQYSEKKRLFLNTNVNQWNFPYPGVLPNHGETKSSSGWGLFLLLLIAHRILLLQQSVVFFVVVVFLKIKYFIMLRFLNETFAWKSAGVPALCFPLQGEMDWINISNQS